MTAFGISRRPIGTASSRGADKRSGLPSRLLMPSTSTDTGALRGHSKTIYRCIHPNDALEYLSVALGALGRCKGASMRRIFVVVLLLSALSRPALADQSTNWMGCDGLPKPIGVGGALAKWLGTANYAGMMGLTDNALPGPMDYANAGVAACSEAITDPDLKTLWARKANLLKSRAMHQVEAGNLDAALVDLQSIHDVVISHVGESAYRRSLGLSDQLFEAAVLAKRGRYAEAEAAAAQASDDRPYSAKVVELAFAVMDIYPDWDAQKGRIADRAAALDPHFRVQRALLREWSRSPDGAADDWLAVLNSGQSNLPPFPDSDPLIAVLSPPLPPRDPGFLAKAAFSAARAGRLDQAAKLASELSAMPAESTVMKGRASERLSGEIKLYQANNFNNLLKLSQDQVPIIEAETLAVGGKLDAAAEIMAAQKRFPASPLSADLMSRLAVSGEGVLPPGRFPIAAAGNLLDNLRRAETTSRAARLDVLHYANALPPLEQTQIGSYSARRFLGLIPNGFEDKAFNGDGGRTITFTSAVAEQAAVEELMLMRGAQLALAAGKPGFLIIARRDFKQMLVTHQFGQQTSSTPHGFKSEIDVVYVDAAALPPVYASQKDRVLDATQIWNDLAPIYGADKPGF